MMTCVILQNVLAAEGLLERKRSKEDRKEKAKTEPKESAEIERFRYIGQEPLKLIYRTSVRRVEHTSNKPHEAEGLKSRSTASVLQVSRFRLGATTTASKCTANDIVPANHCQPVVTFGSDLVYPVFLLWRKVRNHVGLPSTSGQQSDGIAASMYFRRLNIPVIFTAVSADADHGMCSSKKPPARALGVSSPMRSIVGPMRVLQLLPLRTFCKQLERCRSMQSIPVLWTGQENGITGAYSYQTENGIPLLKLTCEVSVR